MKGPGRFVIFGTGQDVEPYLSVYPDSDKVGGPEGILLRSSAVGYWHGEGTGGPSEPVEIVREPESSPPQPAVNAPALREGVGSLGPLLGADRLDGTVVDLDPGEGSEPYHYVYGREEWLLVLAGRPSRCSPAAQSRRVGRARAPLVDDGPAGQCLLPGLRALADP